MLTSFKIFIFNSITILNKLFSSSSYSHMDSVFTASCYSSSIYFLVVCFFLKKIHFLNVLLLSVYLDSWKNSLVDCKVLGFCFLFFENLLGVSLFCSTECFSGTVWDQFNSFLIFKWFGIFNWMPKGFISLESTLLGYISVLVLDYGIFFLAIH